jgi:quercetin dioxygenase-like cupin family protein
VLTVQAVSFREDSKSDTMKLIHIASIEKGGSSMIRKSSECQIEYREHMRDGDGTVQLTNFITGPEELNGKGRLFSRITLNPGCSIGYHVHEGDAELFYILKGTAEYSDNGTVKQVTAGDVTICPDGEGHGIANRTDEVVELIAVIVYA